MLDLVLSTIQIKLFFLKKKLPVELLNKNLPIVRHESSALTSLSSLKSLDSLILGWRSEIDTSNELHIFTDLKPTLRTSNLVQFPYLIGKSKVIGDKVQCIGKWM